MKKQQKHIDQGPMSPSSPLPPTQQSVDLIQSGRVYNIGNTMYYVTNMEFTFLLEKQKLQEVLLRKLKICFYRFDYFFLTSINNRNRLFKMWKFLTCLSVILTISLITDTHEILLKCKEPVRRFHASKIKREWIITITQLQHNLIW